MKLKIVGTNKEITKEILCNIGDIIKVKDYGNIYDYYTDAFIYFNIEYYHPLNYSIRWNNHPYLGLGDMNLGKKYLKNTNWKIIDVALHRDGDTILYFIVSSKHLALVIGESGIKKNKNLWQLKKKPLTKKV